MFLFKNLPLEENESVRSTILNLCVDIDSITMPYVTDGSVHHTGIANEKKLGEAFNKAPPALIRSDFPTAALRFDHRGGTRGVSDLDVCDVDRTVATISVKNHTSTGTFDHINASRTADYIPETTGLHEKLAAYRRDFFGREDQVEPVKRIIANEASALLDRMNSDGIKRLLRTAHERGCSYVAIRTPTDVVVARGSDFVEFATHPYDPETTYELRSARAKTSRQVWRTKGGVSTNTHLRIRLGMNNGVSALLGLSKANTNSHLSLKIQQDNVAGLLSLLRRIVRA